MRYGQEVFVSGKGRGIYKGDTYSSGYLGNKIILEGTDFETFCYERQVFPIVQVKPEDYTSNPKIHKFILDGGKVNFDQAIHFWKEGFNVLCYINKDEYYEFPKQYTLRDFKLDLNMMFNGNWYVEFPHNK